MPEFYWSKWGLKSRSARSTREVLREEVEVYTFKISSPRAGYELVARNEFGATKRVQELPNFIHQHDANYFDVFAVEY